MGKVLQISKISNFVTTLRKQKIVLVGGCFDILHPGHIIFLQKAKLEGDVLIILLESDEKIQQLKGEKRPIHNQNQRAKVLSALSSVDVVILLPFINKDTEYEELIARIRPDVIAVTKGDPSNHHKQRIAKLVGAKLKYIAKVSSHSSTNILEGKRDTRFYK